MGFVCCRSGYGSTTLSVNSRLVHLLAVLIPLTYHAPLFCFPQIPFLWWDAATFSRLTDMCSFAWRETDVGTKSNVKHQTPVSLVSLCRTCGMKAAGSGNTQALSLNSQILLALPFFLSLFFYCLDVYNTQTHLHTHTHSCVIIQQIYKYLLVSAVNRAPRIHPLMRTMPNKAEQLALFHTTPVWEHIYIYTYTRACTVDKAIQALYIACFLMSSHTHARTHISEALALWGKLNLSLIAEDRRVFIQTYTYTHV